MSPFLLALLLMVGLGSQGQWWLTPATRYELGLREKRPPHCRPATRAELAGEGLAPVGKASTYNFKGFYVCEGRIIQFGDRDTFVEFVAQHAVTKAKAIARGLAERDREAPALWSLEVEADDPQLRHYIETIWRTELVQALGAARVTRRRGDTGDPEARRLVVAVRRVQDPSLLFSVYAFEPPVEPVSADESPRWRAL